MDTNNPDILHAYAEGFRDGHKTGWAQAKEEDVRILKGACEPERADPGFGEME